MKPNILFITTDQQRKDTLGCYGNHRIRTPNLDRLAAEGVVFDRAYCESPICIPSRVTMITGKNAAHHGATLHNSSMRDGERTLGHALAENGYLTHYVGKCHFKSQQRRGTEESIADWRDGLYEGWKGPYAGFQTLDMILGHSNSLVGQYGEWLRREHSEVYREFIYENLDNRHPRCGQGVYRNEIPEEAHSSTYVGERTCDFLEKATAEKRPFYCFASFPDPHWPIMPPKEFYDMYNSVEMPENTPYNGEAEKDNYPRQFKVLKEGRFVWYDGGSTYLDPACKGQDLEIMRAYWGAISLIDKNVGKILQKLKSLGLEDNTLVVFTTDHGEYMGAHGMMAKGGFLWEEFVNVPFIAKLPGVCKAGTRTNALLSFTDIVPTILDICGMAAHGMAPDGISQLPVLNGAKRRLRDCATIMHPGLKSPEETPDIHAIVTDEWKLVYYAGDGNGELYNLTEDPKEMTNLYNRSESSGIQRELCLRLLDQLILTNDKQPHLEARAADAYGEHVMKYPRWRPEFDELGRRTGLPPLK